MTLDWDAHVTAWSHPPVDDVGYLAAWELLALSDDDLRAVVDRMRSTRYGGWRNHRDQWRDLLGLDTTTGKRVLDLGCGVGLEALEYLRSGNTVDVADIVPENTALAQRVARVYGYEGRLPVRLAVRRDPPFVTRYAGWYDVVHCVGVLHHVPWARDLVERCHGLLTPDGELRLMLYSDVGWRLATGTEPPSRDELTTHPRFRDFVRFFDGVGEYAEWYDCGKITELSGDLFDVRRCEYITPDDRYLVATLTRR